MKRANGAGSIYRRADGRWVAAVSLPTGRRVTRLARTKREAQAKLRELRRGAAPPPAAVQPDSPTLSRWAAQWLAMRDGAIRPSTWDGYREVLGMLPVTLAQTRLGDLTPLALSESFTNLRQAGRGQRAIQRCYTVLRVCLRDAVAMGLLDANPLDRVPKPRYAAASRRYWTATEWRRFLDTALSSPRKHAPLCAVLATTGLRISEALALEWADVDLQRGVVQVSKGMVKAAGVWHTLPPKTAAGHREVSLPAAAVRALLRLEQTRRWVFHDGAPPSQPNLSRDLTALCRAAGVPRIHVHGLRHVAATMALAASRDPHAVQRRLGHSHVSTTIGLYGYALEPDDAVAGAMDRLLGQFPHGDGDLGK